MMPSGHKAFLVNNVRDLELLLMHNRTYAAEYVADLRLENQGLGMLTMLQDRTRRVVEEEGRDCLEGEAVGRQGHERQGQAHHRVVDGRSLWHFASWILKITLSCYRSQRSCND